MSQQTWVAKLPETIQDGMMITKVECIGPSREDLRASWKNMLLTIDTDRGKTTKPESRTIRRRTKTHATPVFVYNLRVRRSIVRRSPCEDENLTWQRDLTSLDLRNGDKSNIVHKSTNITWADCSEWHGWESVCAGLHGLAAKSTWRHFGWSDFVYIFAAICSSDIENAVRKHPQARASDVTENDYS